MAEDVTLELLQHLGVAGEAGRAAELGARGFDAITANPAN
jgi:hypothetical protein